MGLNSAHAKDNESILPEEVQDMLVEAREELVEIDEKVRGVVRDHPFLTLFGAVAGGYLLGRLIAKR